MLADVIIMSFISIFFSFKLFFAPSLSYSVMLSTIFLARGITIEDVGTPTAQPRVHPRIHMVKNLRTNPTFSEMRA